MLKTIILKHKNTYYIVQLATSYNTVVMTCGDVSITI